MSKILVVGPAWVGDMVMAQTLFSALKSRPNATVDVVAPPWTASLAQRMPEISKAYSLNIKHGEWGFKKRREMAAVLKQENYDEAIVMPNSWKAALIPFLAGIPKRTGWLGEMRYGLLNDYRALDKQKYPLCVERFVALSVPAKAALPNIKAPKLQVHADDVRKVLAKFQLNPNVAPVLALAPGAEFGPSKRWPTKYFAQVADAMAKQGHQVWVFGSPNDQPVAEELIGMCQASIVNLVGRTNLAEAIDLLSCAQNVVANDSGLMHIAAALDKKVVAVYGSTSESFTPPLSDKAIVVKEPQACSPCFKRVCPLQHHECMEKLLPAKVLSHLGAF